MIKEVIVVEGRDDITAVKKAVDAEIIATSGFGINAKIIDKIIEKYNFFTNDSLDTIYF